MTCRSAAATAIAAAALLIGAVAPAAQTDLDAFMRLVIARRDENWKKLQQYVLDERETVQLTGADGGRLYGYRRTYTWFIRQGYFIRSPLDVDGVKVSERERATFEQRWLEREQRRDKYGEKITGLSIPGGLIYGPERDEEAAAPAPSGTVSTAAPAAVGDVLKQTMEPRFVSAAYFLHFKFDAGHYALAGRERIGDRAVLRIEYYPSLLFTVGQTPPDRKKKDEALGQKLNKVALVTLWIDPAEHQIVQYTFDNIDMDFLPARSLVRLDDLQASMRMTQPAANLWLPGTIDIRFRVTLANGPMTAKYLVEYHDYRQADVTIKIK